jgi:sigma-B regulation protein RsbU (phosphoserine phosphatase)
MDYSLLLVTSVLLFVEVCIIIAVSYLIIKKKLLNEVITKRITPLHQVGLMLTFGILSVLSSYAGVQAEGAIASIRDFSPMISGLTFGPLVGVGVGLIGGIHRFYLGGPTAVPCALATILSGVFAGVIYYFSKGKFVYISIAVIFAAAMEFFHMGLILILAKPYTQAVTIVQAIMVPMVFAITFGMLLYSFIITKMIERGVSKIHDEIP